MNATTQLIYFSSSHASHVLDYSKHLLNFEAFTLRATFKTLVVSIQTELTQQRVKDSSIQGLPFSYNKNTLVLGVN